MPNDKYEAYAKLKEALENGTLDQVCAEIKSQREKESGTIDRVNGEVERFIKDHLCPQMIFYGAPGTGKSFIIDVLTQNFEIERTTFHPESDYSSFVGCYKPVSISKDGESLIEYKYVAQSFIRVYIKALKEPDKLHFLIIEEINRGNCAAVFGDLFQLLDRNDEGESSYAINCDSDITSYLEAEFGTEERESFIMFDTHKIALPKNFYIWATMNTSDQSLFPMDSAFKRRWDMEYVRISDAHKDWVIETLPGVYKSWYSFLAWINGVILNRTQSQDKQLGYFFLKPSGKGRVINRRRFINKVIFYLWNDVFRDYMKSETPFDLSTDRGNKEQSEIKESLGKESYIIESFEQFLNGDTLSDFLWHLGNVEYEPEADEHDSVEGPSGTGTGVGTKSRKGGPIDARSILDTGKITEVKTGLPPSSVPTDADDYKAILCKTTVPTPFYQAKSYKDVALGLYFLTCHGLSVTQAIDKWSAAIKKINSRRDASKWIRNTPPKPKDQVRWVEIDTGAGSVYIFKDTSKGANNGTWEFMKKLAEDLGVKIID